MWKFGRGHANGRGAEVLETQRQAYRDEIRRLREENGNVEDEVFIFSRLHY